MAKKYVRKLQRTGDYTYTLSIPKELIDEFDWQERQKIEIVNNGRKQNLTLRDWEG